MKAHARRNNKKLVPVKLLKFPANVKVVSGGFKSANPLFRLAHAEIYQPPLYVSAN